MRRKISVACCECDFRAVMDRKHHVDAPPEAVKRVIICTCCAVSPIAFHKAYYDKNGKKVG